MTAGKPAISQLREVPERSEVVVLIAQDEVVLRAKLLAAGAMAVLSRETPPEDLAAALEMLAVRANEPRCNDRGSQRNKGNRPRCTNS